MAQTARQWMALAAMTLLIGVSAERLRAQGAPATSAAPPATQGAAAGDTSGKQVPPRQQAPGNAGSLMDWLRMVLALAVVVGLIFVTRWLLKRAGAAAGITAGGRAVEVLARSPLSSRHQMYLVRMGRRLLLVGSGPEGLRTLSEVTDQQEVQDLLKAVAAGAPTLSAMFHGKRSSPGPAGQGDSQRPGGTP